MSCHPPAPFDRTETESRDARSRVGIHRAFAEAVACDDGKLKRLGRADRRRHLLFDFEDGAPSNATPDKVYDSLDFAHAFRAFADARGTAREPCPLRLFLVESASGEGVA
jgi:hypothetical protein